MSKRVTARGAEFREKILPYFHRLIYRIVREIPVDSYADDYMVRTKAGLREEVKQLKSIVCGAFEDIWEDIRKDRPLSNAGTAKAIQDTKAGINQEVNRMLGQCPLNRDYYEPMSEDVRRITDGHMETLKAKLGVRDV